MKGSMKDAIATCHIEFIYLLLNFKTAVTVKLEPLLENPVLKSIRIILDSESYKFHDVDLPYGKVKVVTDHFKSMPMANGCSNEYLKKEFEIPHDHFKRYVSQNTPEKCWQIIFNIGHDLSIRNLLHEEIFFM